MTEEDRFGGQTVYRDRREAGIVLANHLGAYAGRDDVTVLALPRGGVPIGGEVSRRLPAAFDVFVVRKLGVPGHEELAMGAIASGGIRVLNHSTISWYGLSAEDVDAVERVQQEKLVHRERMYRDGRPMTGVRGRVVLLVDDGIATGATMRAALLAVRQLDPARVVVAAPVGSPDTCAELAREADAVICPLMPPRFSAVGAWYQDFAQTTDEEVRAILFAHSRSSGPP